MFAAINALADTILGSLHATGLIDAIVSLAGVSAVLWFGVFAALRIAVEPGASAWRRGDRMVLGITVLCALLPATWTAAVGVFLLGAYLVLSAQDGRARRIALVLLALSGTLLWGKIVLLAFAPIVLAADGQIVGAIVGTGATGNLVGFVGGGQFVIGGPCSSVHNISLALLLWSCVVALLDLTIDRRLILVGVAAMAAMYALNLARLSAIALFPTDFEWLHLGTGATLFGWAGLLLAGLIIGAGAYDALARRA